MNGEDMSEPDVVTSKSLPTCQERRQVARDCDWNIDRGSLVIQGTDSTIGWMKAWLEQRLPGLNELAFNESLRVESLAAILSADLLSQLPPTAALNPRQAWQVLMMLGCCGSSVERHAQQACVRRGETATPGTGLGWVTVRGGRQRFMEYFRQVADVVGHPYRDTFATFVDFSVGLGIKLRMACGAGSPALLTIGAGRVAIASRPA
jgi:hypothetical protein